MMHRRALRLALGALALTANASRAQHAFIVGTVRTSDSALPLAYTGVSIPTEGRDRLSSDKGVFSFGLLKPGRVTVRFRHVGFSPVDTQVVLSADDTLRLEVTMSRLAIHLDAMRVTAYADSMSPEMRLVLDQIGHSAAQYRTLVNIYPFSKTMGYRDVERMKDGTFQAGPPDVFEIDMTDEANYRRGRVFRTVRGSKRLVFPTLLDLAAKEFRESHRFTFAGEVVVDTNRFVKILFAPVPTLTDPDIEGTITLRATDFGLVSMELKTTGIPTGQQGDIESMRVVTHFREIFPGIPVASTVESFITPGPRVEKKFPNLATRGEIQVMEQIRWKNGPP